MLYLDYNATTPIAAEVREAMLPYLSEKFGNPSSSHALGRAAREAVEQARAQVAALIGAEPDEIFFTSGGTESSNLAITGSVYQRRCQSRIVISAIEHPATVAPAAFLESLGHAVVVVPCDRHAVIDVTDLAAAMTDETGVVSVMHANNEVGTIQPIAEISAVCRDREVPLHVDAAQSVGKIDVHVDRLGVDLLTIAGHKLYAPKGIGALYVRRGIELAPVLRGAGQERGLRPGTENVAMIVGLGRAAVLARSDLHATGVRLAAFRDRLEAGLRQEIGPRLIVHAAGAPRLPNTTSVNVPDVAGQDMLDRLEDLCASTGAACHSGRTTISSTLAAMGVAPEDARGTLRLSVGKYTTELEIDHAITRLVETWRSTRTP